MKSKITIKLCVTALSLFFLIIGVMLLRAEGEIGFSTSVIHNSVFRSGMIIGALTVGTMLDSSRS